MASVPFSALAQVEAPRATVAIVGDPDRFNIGQDGYCGKRTEIENPAGKSFRIPAGIRTNFFVRSRFRTTDITVTCEGDFSFMPEPGVLHVIRYTMVDDNKCRLELFRSEPGGTPVPMPVAVEPRQACLAK